MPEAVPRSIQGEVFAKIATAIEHLVVVPSDPQVANRAYSAIAATYKDLPSTVDGNFAPLFRALATYVTSNLNSFSGPQLVHAATGFCSGKYADAAIGGAVADAAQRQLGTLDPGSLARIACELAEMYSPPAAVLDDIAWECLNRQPETRIEVRSSLSFAHRCLCRNAMAQSLVSCAMSDNATVQSSSA